MSDASGGGKKNGAKKNGGKKQDDGESGSTASEPADADLTLEPTDGGGGGEEPDQQADPRWR
jgi:hypothetical protein